MADFEFIQSLFSDFFKFSNSSHHNSLVFSQSLLSLDIIEDFLSYKTEEALKQNALIDAIEFVYGT